MACFLVGRDLLMLHVQFRLLVNNLSILVFCLIPADSKDR